MTKLATPLDSRNAALASTDVPASDASCMNTAACATVIAEPSSEPSSAPWIWPKASYAPSEVQAAWVMTKLATPLDSRNAALASTDVPASDASCINAAACATVISERGGLGAVAVTI